MEEYKVLGTKLKIFVSHVIVHICQNIHHGKNFEQPSTQNDLASWYSQTSSLAIPEPAHM